jgi:hypothetical protein
MSSPLIKIGNTLYARKSKLQGRIEVQEKRPSFSLQMKTGEFDECAMLRRKNPHPSPNGD